MKTRAIRALAFVVAIAISGPQVLAQATRKPPPKHQAVKQGAATQVKPGSIEGDVYLVNRLGDTKPAAGRTIYLLADTPEFAAVHAALCAKYETRIRAAEAADEAVNRAVAASIASSNYDPNASFATSTSRVFDEAVDSVRQLIHSDVRAEVETGMKAHYRFDSVPPGKYVLFGEWEIARREYQWWAPIELAPGQVMRKDLNNDALAHFTVYCGIR